MNADKLVKIHLELECVRVDENHFMSQLECPNPDGLFRFYITQHDGGYSRYYRNDLATSVYQQIKNVPPKEAFLNIEMIKNILAVDHPCAEMHEGKSYIFPATITSLDYPDVVFSELAACIMQNGEVVSSCISSRENATAAEAWVFTQPDYRGRGYGRQVTMAWGHHLQKQGKIPFYSHVRTNLASEAVARSLGLMKYIEDIGYV